MPKLLVIDSEYDRMVGLRKLFKEEGIKVVSAKNMLQAIRFLRAKSFDAVC